MPTQLDFFYDFGSPHSYLAYKRLAALVERTGALVNYRPILLGGVFKAVGNPPPMEVKAKADYVWVDISRFTERYKIPMTRNWHFPLNSLYLMRGAIAAQKLGQLISYSEAIFDALWIEGLNLGDAKTVAKVLDRAGFDSQALFAAIDREEVKSELKINTEEAVARGAFGVPTFFIGDTMYFGQDRLEYVEAHLQKLSNAGGPLFESRTSADGPYPRQT